MPPSVPLPLLAAGSNRCAASSGNCPHPSQYIGQQCHMDGKILKDKRFVSAPASTALATYSVVSPSISSASPTIMSKFGNCASPSRGVLIGLANGSAMRAGGGSYVSHGSGSTGCRICVRIASGKNWIADKVGFLPNPGFVGVYCAK